jgi:hypothetical protein
MLHFNIQHFKKNLGFFIVIIICLPLFFINVKNCHDWGSDFAQYIHQAINIVKGIPQSETGYVFNKDIPFLGPPAYTMGFPILLSPIYYFFGNNIKAFAYFISFLLFLVSIFTYFFYKKHFSALTSIILIVILIYNPWVLYFKQEIMSEIPFTLFLFLIVFINNHYKKRYNYFINIGIGLLCGFLISIRQIGVVILMAIIVELIIDLIKEYKAKNFSKIAKHIIIHNILIIVTAILSYFLLNSILFHIKSNGFDSYLSLLNIKSTLKIIGLNLSYYTDVFKSFFSYENPHFHFMTILIQSFVLIFTIIGMIMKFIKKFDLIDSITLFYILTLLCYPYQKDGIRLLFPILPFLFYYLVLGIKNVKISFKYTKKQMIILLFGLFILFQYLEGITNLIKQQKDVIYGPQDKDAVEAFNYIKTHIPKNAIIDFMKPRALALYTDRKGYAHSENYTLQELKNKFDEIGVSYVLYNEPFGWYAPDEVLKEYIKVYKDNLILLWNNNMYKIYMIKNNFKVSNFK